MEKKCVLITGAVRNTGPVIAEKFAADGGYDIILTSRNGDEAVRAAKGIEEKFGTECLGFELDQVKINTVAPLFKTIAKAGKLVDTVVLNAAHLGVGMDSLTVEAKEFEQVIRTNLTGGFMIAREAAARLIKAGKKGAIVVIGSNTSKRAIVDRCAYIASKGGLLSLVKALALEWAKFGIRVNYLMPGPIHTDRWDVLDEAAAEARRKRAPLGREATAADIANGVYYLATDMSANTTGAELLIDGGLDVQLFPEW